MLKGLNMKSCQSDISNSEEIVKFDYNVNRLGRALMFLQIAIVINVLLPLIYTLIGRVMSHLLTSESLFKMSDISNPIWHIVNILFYSLMLIGLWRIIQLFRHTIHIFYSISAMLVFSFLLYLRAIDFWHYILIRTGHAYMQSDWPVIALLILPPFGIYACYKIADNINQHSVAILNKRKLIIWMTVVFVFTWLLRMAFSFLLWLQNSDIIDFKLRWLVMYRYRWQWESIFYYRLILICTFGFLLWQVWLFFGIRSFRVGYQEYLLKQEKADLK
jgi:hypothetical protein